MVSLAADQPLSTADQALQLPGSALQQLRITTDFHIQAQQRFGIGRPQVKPPLREFETDAVGFIQRQVLRGIGRQNPADFGWRIGNPEIAFAAARKRPNPRIDQRRSLNNPRQYLPSTWKECYR